MQTNMQKYAITGYNQKIQYLEIFGNMKNISKNIQYLEMQHFLLPLGGE